MRNFLFKILILYSSVDFEIVFVSSKIVDNSGFPNPDLVNVPFVDEDGWTGGISVLTGESVNNRDSVLSENKTEVEFVCTAPYPIQWDITGYIQPPEFVKIQPYRREKFNETRTIYSLKLFIFFTPFEPETEVASSGLITCTSIDNPSKFSSMCVFVPGSKSFVKSGANYLLDTSLIPCATTNPTVPVNIFKKSRNGRMNWLSKANANFTYDPVEGFRFPDLVEGQFTCISGSDNVFFDAKVSNKSEIPGFDYFPKSKSVKAFTNDIILLNCSSTDPTQKLTIMIDSSNITINEKPILRNGKSVEISSKTEGSGIIQCIDGNQRTVGTWEYKFIDPPELYLDNFEGEVDCLSDHENRTVSTVRCKDPSDCRFMKHCFRNASLCNFKRQKQFTSGKEVRCLIKETSTGAFCASLPYSHLNGLVQCSVDGLSRYWEFFVSLNFLRHSNWETVPVHELVRMDEVEDILYTNYTSTFFCAATAYLFADSIVFSIEYENGTTEFLNENQYTNPGSEDPRKIDEFNVIGELKINLTVETVAVNCHAPWWNSTDYMIVHRRFLTRHLLTPIIEATSNRKTFTIGAKIQRLICMGKGEPRPNYFWYKDRKLVDEASKLSITTGSKGESILEFPIVDEADKGMYSCEANNSVGNASFGFFVETVEQGVSTTTVVYGTTVGVILFVLAFVLCILGLVFFQYRKTMALLRGLTDDEIDEFFKGKPEFIDSYQRLTNDTLDLLPYDPAYEIDLDDIDFDSSDVLGSGEFSYVVKGSIKSTGRDVAVKIAKSSADVTLFKSLLSEVKIMIFIGQHHNVVALVGVSTTNIRNRTIHIVMELCDVGSLEHYLRKNRKEFSNLIDQNQKINTALMMENAKVSTLNLVRWSEEIATGMEYLAFKLIVHADLAARNVLLNNDQIAKISDFGLSKKLYECNNYVKKTKSPLPWRWMALESLTTLSFSSDSDIWSFGVTLWEIFTLGDIPFPNESWNKDFINRLASGMRMGRPKFSTPEIYSKIVACWDDDSTLRPNFTTLRTFFHDLYASLVPLKDSPETVASGATYSQDSPATVASSPRATCSQDSPDFSATSTRVISTSTDSGAKEELEIKPPVVAVPVANQEDDVTHGKVGPLYSNISPDATGDGARNYENYDPNLVGQPNYANMF